MAPFFSILMPVYNAEPYVREAIDSLLRQSFADWELIAVDDCSTDNSFGIVEEYARQDARVQAERMLTHAGSPLLVRLHGFQKATGKYIVEIDSDDFVSRDYLEKIYDKIGSLGAETVLTTIFRTDSQGKTTHPHITYSREFIESGFQGKDMIIDTIRTWKIGGLGAFDRSIIYEVIKNYPIPFDNYNADELLTRLIIFHSSKVAFSDAVYFYRELSDSITHKSFSRVNEVVKSHEFLEKFILDNYSSKSPEYQALQIKKIELVYWIISESCKDTLDQENKDGILKHANRIRKSVDRKNLRNWKQKIFVSLNFTLLKKLVRIDEKRRRNKRI